MPSRTVPTQSVFRITAPQHQLPSSARSRSQPPPCPESSAQNVSAPASTGSFIAHTYARRRVDAGATLWWCERVRCACSVVCVPLDNATWAVAPPPMLRCGAHGRVPTSCATHVRSVWHSISHGFTYRTAEGRALSRPLLAFGCIRQPHTRSTHTGAANRAYDAPAVERKWQQRWAAQGTPPRPAATPDQGAFYSLPMFPYPSGSLHMGHVRVYTISDAVSRFRRMRGHEVLHPIGWDAFGLPAENAALQRHESPASWTEHNIAHMRSQLKALGISFDWDREVATCSPDYYRWTQWLFLQLHKAGLAYQDDAAVNWDPVDGTVLANEQVDPQGRSWRSGAVVERRRLKQWYFRITAFAQELDDDLDSELLRDWPDRVRSLQRNWIGRSEGTTLVFKLAPDHVAGLGPSLQEDSLSVFTTRADTLFGVKFLVVAHDHPLVGLSAARLDGLSPSDSTLKEASGERIRLFAANAEARATAAAIGSGKGADVEPTFEGLDLGVSVLHPMTGEAIPVFVSDYVVSEYGTGSVMGVPAHDSRDAAFADKQGIPFKTVVVQTSDSEGAAAAPDDRVFTGRGVLVDSGPFSGVTSDVAIEQIGQAAESGGWGGPATQFKLRDWLVSRQRYWGAPIPMVHCPECGPVPVPEDELPVLLPELSADEVESVLLGNARAAAPGSEDTWSGSPLSRLAQWKHTHCPCERRVPAVRDTDTLDTFVDSSWYFLRYPDPSNEEAAFSREALAQWSPVSFYVGGIEHAILHLLYSRFIHKVAHHVLGVTPTREPFSRLLTQGMVLGQTFKDKSTGQYLTLNGEQASSALAGDSVRLTLPGDASDAPVVHDVEIVWEKMSKSKNNGVDPVDVIRALGADVTRLFTLFKAPPEKEMQWDTAALSGQARWVERLIGHIKSVEQRATSSDRAGTGASIASDASLRAAVHSCIDAVTRTMESTLTFNVAVAELMKLSNAIGDAAATGVSDAEYEDAVRTLTVMLAPFAPHLASEMWERLCRTSVPPSMIDGGLTVPDVHAQAWPVFDASAVAVDHVIVVVQVNGKRKGELRVPSSLIQRGCSSDDAQAAEEAKQAVQELAINHDVVLSALGADAKAVKRVIAVLNARTPLVNIVL